jgi:hypothetical protein
MPFHDLLTHAIGSLAEGGTLLAPIPGAAVDAWERLRGVPVSPEIRALCSIAGGVRRGDEELHFLGGAEDGAHAFSSLLPLGEAIGGDGKGNLYVVDSEDGFGLAGPVYFAAPNPGVLVVAAPSLLDFVRSTFLANDKAQRFEALEQAIAACKSHKDFAPEAALLRTAPDAALRALCMQVPDDARIYDLRRKEFGSGFPWAAYPSATRDPLRPLFVGLPPEKRPSVLARIFGIG